MTPKKIPTQERLIFALDVENTTKAKDLVAHLDDSVHFYKIGLELLMSGEYFALLNWLIKHNKKVFVDLKFFDVPATVGRTVARLADYGASFTTVHGNQNMMLAAAKNKGMLKILAVTALTSLDEGDLKDLGFECSVQELVLSRAKRALQAGCDGVISSGLEIAMLRKFIKNELLIITPGIRPVSNKDDQKRIIDLEDAFKIGTDYVVVGRPIRDAKKPYQVAKSMQMRIAQVFKAHH